MCILPSATKAVFPPFLSRCLAPHGESSVTEREQSSSNISVVAAILILASCQEECRNSKFSRRKLLFTKHQTSIQRHVALFRQDHTASACAGPTGKGLQDSPPLLLKPVFRGLSQEQISIVT